MQKHKQAVLDSYALLAFLFREPGYREVLALLEWAVDRNIKHLMASVN